MRKMGAIPASLAPRWAAAIVVGGLIGWLLDRGLGTKPAFMIVFFMLGVAAGVWNVIRATSPASHSARGDKGKTIPPRADGDED
jgi:ATP synthase protein I